MLGHLVFGRYGAGSERSLATVPVQSGWMRRVLGAMFRRR
jgi:hypothetical protein